MYVDEANTDIDGVVITVSGTDNTVSAGTPAEIDAHNPFTGNTRGGIAANGSAQGGISIFWKNDNDYIRGGFASVVKCFCIKPDQITLIIYRISDYDESLKSVF